MNYNCFEKSILRKYNEIFKKYPVPPVENIHFQKLYPLKFHQNSYHPWNFFAFFPTP